MKQTTTRALRSPIERAGLNEVYARVCYQLVVLDYRRSPDPYKSHPPTPVLELAHRLRAEGFPYLYAPLVSLAKALAEGLSSAEWRELYPSLRGPRALHKQRLLRGPR